MKSNDFNSLLLFYSSVGDAESLEKMAKNAEQAGKYNVAFEAFYCLAMPDACIDVLLKAKMVA
mgnify:CR=1 FL=1